MKCKVFWNTSSFAFFNIFIEIKLAVSLSGLYIKQKEGGEDGQKN